MRYFCGRHFGHRRRYQPIAATVRDEARYLDTAQCQREPTPGDLRWQTFGQSAQTDSTAFAG